MRFSKTHHVCPTTRIYHLCGMTVQLIRPFRHHYSETGNHTVSVRHQQWPMAMPMQCHGSAPTIRLHSTECTLCDCINYETLWVVFIIIQEVQQLFCTNVPRNHRYTKTIVLYSLHWSSYSPLLSTQLRLPLLAISVSNVTFINMFTRD